MVTSVKAKVATLNNSTAQKYDLDQKIKKKKRRGLYRRLTVFAILVFAGIYFIGSSLTSQTSVIEQKKKEKVVVEQKLADVKEKKAELKLEVQKLHDNDYIGEIARKEYFLSRPGEVLFKLPTNE